MYRCARRVLCETIHDSLDDACFEAIIWLGSVRCLIFCFVILTVDFLCFEFRLGLFCFGLPLCSMFVFGARVDSPSFSSGFEFLSMRCHEFLK